MSWISDLAGKAENILNKIDQNAANVLQQPVRSEVDRVDQNKGDIKVEESFVEGLKKNLSSSSLSLTKSLTPKKIFRGDLTSKQTEERANNSNLSSRRSSISSKTEATAGEQEVLSVENYVEPKSIEFSTEKELAALRIALAEITTERNELKEELCILQEELKHAAGEAKIRELEVLVNSIAAEREEMTEELDNLRKSNSDFLKTISEMEANSAKSRQTTLELTEKLNWQVEETEQISRELQEYRQKAKSTLQMKDRIIEELKTKGNLSQDVSDSGNEKLLLMEVESLRQENSHLSEELSALTPQLENFKLLAQKLESQLQLKQSEFNALQESFKKSLHMEQQRSNQFESEVKILSQELNALREEVNRQRQSFASQLHEKENQLMRLREKTDEVPAFGDPSNLEGRIDSLTQALVKKQSDIEGITAEKNALRLQLEKVEEQLRHLIAQNRQRQSQIIHINDTDDAKAQLPLLMRENPFDTNVARRVKRAYSTLDAAGIRLGVFLRRYPLIRIMVFIYVALLHLWVMFVLLSSTPT